MLDFLFTKHVLPTQGIHWLVKLTIHCQSAAFPATVAFVRVVGLHVPLSARPFEVAAEGHLSVGAHSVSVTC